LNQKIRAPSTEAVDQEFFDPTVLQSGTPCLPLRDAAQFVTKLRKAEHDADEWQAAMEALLLVAEHDGPTMFAPIGAMQALHRHKPKARPAPRRNAPKVYRFTAMNNFGPSPFSPQ
jgi:hypothetical protein